MGTIIINLNSDISYEQINIGKSKVFKIGDGKKELLHHKFCVIDNNIVLSGSYNWSYKAENNFENIIITFDDASLAEQFISQFMLLKNQFFPNDKSLESDFPLNKIIKRLEILKNHIQLEDIDDVKSESQKLLVYDFNSDINNIIQSINTGELANAIYKIEQFISKNNQVLIWSDPEILALKFEIKILENQLVSFDNEKTEIEQLLHHFQRIHTLKLGSIISELLQLRKLRFKEDKDKFEEAEKDEKEYKKQIDSETKKEVFELTKEEEKDIKKTYRQAVVLCHPDKFSQESIEVQKQAEQVMIELAIANEKKDLKRVKEILNELQNGILNPSNENVISDKLKLKEIIKNLKTKVKKIEDEIIILKDSAQYQIISEIEDKDKYFEELKIILTKELEKLREELKHEIA